MTKTIHDRLVEALLERGAYVVENARTTKYTVLTREGLDGFFFIGRSGAFRAGRSVSDSLPVAARFRRRLLEGGGH